MRITKFTKNKIAKEVLSLVGSHNNIQLLCIGTDRATGDTLAPLVGTMLTKKKYPFPLYGTLENPVHAQNVVEIWNNIKHKGFTIAIDASLGDMSKIGNINIVNKPMYPGSALNKDLPPVGDISIAGCVNVSGYLEQMVLQNTRLFHVWKMAEYITSELNIVAKHIIKSQKEIACCK